MQCISCDFREPRAQTQKRLEWDNRHLPLPADEVGDAEGVIPPTCPLCGGWLKPAVVFFGESVPADKTEQRQAGRSRMRRPAGGGLVANRVVGIQAGEGRHDSGKPLYILNIGPTRADNEATLKVEAPAGATLSRIARDIDS